MHTVFLLDEETPTVFEQSLMFLDILNDISQDKIQVELEGDDKFNGHVVSCTKVYLVSEFRRWIWDLMNKTIIHFGMMFISKDGLVIHGNEFVSIFIIQESNVLDFVFQRNITNVIGGVHIEEFLTEKIPSGSILGILNNEHPDEIGKIKKGKYKIKVKEGTLESLSLPLMSDENVNELKKASKDLPELKRAIGDVRLGPGLNTKDIFNMKLWLYNVNNLGDKLREAYKTQLASGDKNRAQLARLFLHCELSGTNDNYDEFDKTAYGVPITRENFSRVLNFVEYFNKFTSEDFTQVITPDQKIIEFFNLMLLFAPYKLISGEWPNNHEEFSKIIRKNLSKNKYPLELALETIF